MAVISLPTSVTPGADANIRQGTSGAALQAGEVLYLNSVTGRLEVADADGAAATAEVVGIALNSAPAAGQPVDYITDGTLNGATLLKSGQVYILSNTPGDVSELVTIAIPDTTEDVSYVTGIGIGLSTTSMKIKINASGVRMNLA